MHFKTSTWNTKIIIEEITLKILSQNSPKIGASLGTMFGNF